MAVGENKEGAAAPNVVPYRGDAAAKALGVVGETAESARRPAKGEVPLKHVGLTLPKKPPPLVENIVG